MNLFELNVFAAPAAGIFGALAAAPQKDFLGYASAGGIGLLTGAGLYLAILGMGWLACKIGKCEKPKSQKEMNRGGFLMFVFVLLPMMMLPFLSGFAANGFVRLILK